MRGQRRVNCGAEVVIPNVLPYLISDAEKNTGNDVMDESSSGEEDSDGMIGDVSDIDVV